VDLKPYPSNLGLFFMFPFFLRFVDQTLRTEFAIKIRIITGYPWLKALPAVSDLMFLAGKHPFPVRMVSTIEGHDGSIPYSV